MKNYYGSLCTKMYEILHSKAPEDELNFYLSFANKNMSILEPMCGTGRFLGPFLEMGFNINGLDSSEEMLLKLKQKYPNAKVFNTNPLNINQKETYDYIFITSGSVSLFTNIEELKTILKSILTLLKPNGKFVFAVDTLMTKSENDKDVHYESICKN